MLRKMIKELEVGEGPTASKSYGVAHARAVQADKQEHGDQGCGEPGSEDQPKHSSLLASPNRSRPY